MAYSAITKPSLHFNTKLYTGNGGTNAITGVGFQPDWVVMKDRDNGNWGRSVDNVRGVHKGLIWALNYAEQSSETTGLTAFGTDGFTLGSATDYNGNGADFASWNWKASNSTASNSNGSIASTVSVNTTSGFSVVTFGAYNGTVGHGLGVAPDMFILKNRDDGSTNWFVYHKDLPSGSAGQGSFMTLNSSDTYSDNTGIWSNTAPTSTVFSIGSSQVNNANYVAYCFASKAGFSKVSKYEGNGNNSGPFIYTGFKPAWTMIKHMTGGGASGEHWNVQDVKRSTTNPSIKMLSPNQSSAENSTANNSIDFLSNGFKIRTNDGRLNADGGEYIYLAFAEEPIVANVGTNGIPATAR